MHTEARKDMELDAHWLSSPDGSNWRALLEFSRAAVRSLAFDYQGRAQEVHILKIRRAFDELRAPQLCKYGLKLLSLVGEAQELPGGFWVLAPFRTIPFGYGDFVFVGALPNEELIARYGNIRYEGLGRIVARPETGIEPFPIQPLEAWAGVRSAPVTRVVEELRTNLARNGGVAAQSDSVEYLRLSSMAPQVEWTRVPSPLRVDRRLAICRDRTPFGHRYFAATMEMHRLVKESSLPRSLTEMLPGLAAASSMPIQIQMTVTDNELIVRSYERLPWSLFRVVTLLARSRKRSSVASNYTFAPSLLGPLKGLAEMMGYKVEVVV